MTAGEERSGLGFLPAQGWTVIQSGSLGPTGEARAVAANVPLDAADDLRGLPLATLDSLPTRGVVIFATFTPHGDPGQDFAFAPSELPLRIEDAVGIQSDEVAPDRRLAHYRVLASVGGSNVAAEVFLGTEPAPARLVAAAQRQLNRLVVASDRVTINARRPANRFSSWTLFGSVDSRREGEGVTIQARDCGLPSFRVVDGATTVEGGGWSTPFYPRISTQLRALWDNATSRTIEVRVPVGVYLRKRSRGRLEVAAWGAKALGEARADRAARPPRTLAVRADGEAHPGPADRGKPRLWHLRLARDLQTPPAEGNTAASGHAARAGAPLLPRRGQRDSSPVTDEAVELAVRLAGERRDRRPRQARRDQARPCRARLRRSRAARGRPRHGQDRARACDRGQSIEGATHSRVQCTPDLQPTDVTGLSVFDQRERDFEFRPGPIFANVVLVDEINRAMPKTQSALLEAMAEQQVTVDGVTRPLPDPFLVLATENPIEQEGTFPLPEAQLDRFFLQDGARLSGRGRRAADRRGAASITIRCAAAARAHARRGGRARDAVTRLHRPAPAALDRPARARNARRSTASRSAPRCAAASRSSARRVRGRCSTGATTSTPEDIERLFAPGSSMHRIVFTPSFLA